MFTREKLEELAAMVPGRDFRVSIHTDVKWTPVYMVNKEQQEFIKVVGISAEAIPLAGNTDENYIVSLGYDGDEWFVTVGNTFLSGALAQEAAEFGMASLCDNAKERADMQSLMGQLGEESPSEHWRLWHTKGWLTDESIAFLSKYVTPALLDSMENYFHGQGEVEETEEEMIAARMNLYAFQRHLLFVGEKGGGKTYDIYAYLNREKLPHIFVGGSADTESYDLKGNLLPYEKDGNKNFIWVDGPLTQAFRRAASGEKVVLFIDELLRMSNSAQSLLVPALTTDIEGNYVLDTGRVIDVVDGVGKTECIKAPSSNLWVLATTNMGAEYGVPDMESALEDRFELIEKNNDIAKIARVLTDIANQKGFDGVVEKLTAFYESMVALKKEGMLAKLINLRHLAQSLEDSQSKEDLHDRLMDRLPKWVERDMGGKLIDEQIEVIKRALRKASIQ